MTWLSGLLMPTDRIQKGNPMADSSTSNICAEDGYNFSTYMASPTKSEIGGLILIHEIFGITAQMRNLADQFANAGYKTIVPALFDRIERDACLGYDEIDRGRKLAGACRQEHLLLDLKAAMQTLATRQVAVVGYCWGGGIAYLAACNLPINNGAAFYGTRLPSYLHQQANCPFQFHFGGKDSAIGPEVIEQVRTANPSSDIFIYQQAGHGFANQARASFDAASTILAEQRLLAFLSQRTA